MHLLLVLLLHLLTALTLRGLRIFGSPYVSLTPSRQGMDADNPRRYLGGIRTEEALAELYSEIPPHVDILVTHAPPHGVLDLSTQYGRVPRPVPVHIGSKALAEWLERRKQQEDSPQVCALLAHSVWLSFSCTCLGTSMIPEGVW